MRRQRTLERASWIFWRSFASTFVTHKNEVIAELLATLEALNIQPISIDTTTHVSSYVESRRITTVDDPTSEITVDG